jgi:hypothetical protein
MIIYNIILIIISNNIQTKIITKCNHKNHRFRDQHAVINTAHRITLYKES